MRQNLSAFDLGGSGAPLGNWGAKGGEFASLAALVPRLLLRQDTGLRLVSWSNIIVVTLAMLAVSWFDNAHFSLSMLLGGGVVYGDNTSLRNFAFLWAALAVFEHFKRLDEEKRGVEPHNHSPGVGRLGLAELLPWKPEIIAGVVEPALSFLAGAILRRLGFSMLGWIILASSVCFCISEWRLHLRIKEHIRDRGDLEKEGRWESDLMKEQAERRTRRRDDEASGLETGIGGLEGPLCRRSDAEDAANAGGAL